jgi:hypothetical protein
LNKENGLSKIPIGLIIAIFVFFPPLGIFLFIVRAIVMNTNKNNDTVNDNQEQSTTYSDIEETVNSFFKKEPKTQNFSDSVSVRCTNCNSLNYTTTIPFTCDYCGELITKKN